MNEYMDHTHPDAFKDMPVKDQPKGYPPNANTICPKCKGHGGWHLRIDAYGPGKHFNCSCPQCWGWGWVTDADAHCIHDFETVASDGRGDNTWKCKKCGRSFRVDSSDCHSYS